MEDVTKSIQDRLLEYIVKNTHADTSKVKTDTMLFRDGIFDSMGFVLLIDFIEQAFQVKPNDEDLVESNFESIAAIAGYIHKKQQKM